MVGRSLSPASTTNDAMSYINAVRDAFRDDEPAKYREFFNIFKDFKAKRADIPTVLARMEELMKDHLNLLLGFNAFLPPEARIKIPSKAKKGLGRFEAMVGSSVPQKPASDDACSYMNAVKEAFRDEPAKYREFLKLLDDYSRGVDANSVFARVEKLMKGHMNLLLGFSVFCPALATITIPPPEAEQRAAPDNNKRIRVANFISKIKARFQGDDRHVYESFLQILKMYQEGNKSINELYQEVVALIQGHEDLVMEFSDIFS